MNDLAAPADAAHLARALELAARGLYTTDPNPRVGCVLVRDGRTVGEGWHERAGGPHAEVRALEAAGEAARGAEAFVSLEPCSHVGRTGPCAEALIAAGVRRVVACSADPDPRVSGSGFARLRAAGVEVASGVLETEARALNPGFFSRFERRRPFVRLKMAMTLDARTARGDGTRLEISSPASRLDVQHWRARSGAVLTGSGTVLVDDPFLNVRLDYGPAVRQPLRVVLDSDLRTAPGANIYREGPSLRISAAGRAAPAGGPPVETVPRTATGLDLQAVLTCLAEREVNELLVECGARLAGSFLAAGLVDELVLYVAPRLLGSAAAPLAVLEGFAGTGAFEFRNVQSIGDDVRLLLSRLR